MALNLPQGVFEQILKPIVKYTCPLCGGQDVEGKKAYELTYCSGPSPVPFKRCHDCQHEWEG